MTRLSLYCYKQLFVSLPSTSFPPTILQSDVKPFFLLWEEGEQKSITKSSTTPYLG